MVSIRELAKVASIVIWWFDVTCMVWFVLYNDWQHFFFYIITSIPCPICYSSNGKCEHCHDKLYISSVSRRKSTNKVKNCKISTCWWCVMQVYVHFRSLFKHILIFISYFCFTSCANKSTQGFMTDDLHKNIKYRCKIGMAYYWKKLTSPTFLCLYIVTKMFLTWWSW